MTNEFLKQCSKTAWEQLFMSVNPFVVMSWGVEKKYCTVFQEMPTLVLKVSALIFKGWVFISLNEGKDLYEVRLMKNRNECIKTLDEVYCDELGKTIDELIEKPASMAEDEYLQKAMADSDKKMSEVI